MKKIIYTFFVFSILLSSCVQDVDDVFDEPSSVRVEKALAEYQTLLKSAEYGWAMEYYPSSTQAYGGYLFTMKFKDGDQVTVSTDAFEEAEKEVTSLYSLKKDIGPTLNFDTYNELFHHFSDPDIIDGGGKGKGYEGDYEFIFRSHTDNEIILRGKKTNNVIKMTRLTEPPMTLLDKTVKLSKETFTTTYTASIGGKTFVVPMEDHVFLFSYETEGKKTESVSGPYIFTATGIKFYEPIEVMGKTLENFTWDSATKTFTCTDQGATDVKLTANELPEGYMKYKDFLGSWDFVYAGGRIPVILEEESQTSFLMVGFNPNYKLLVNYDKSVGGIRIMTQKLGNTGSNEVWLCAWDANTGSLFKNTALGVASKPRVNTEDIIIDFESYGVWADHEVNSFIVWEMKGNDYVGEFKQWGTSRYTGYLSMVKNK